MYHVMFCCARRRLPFIGSIRSHCTISLLIFIHIRLQRILSQGWISLDMSTTLARRQKTLLGESKIFFVSSSWRSYQTISFVKWIWSSGENCFATAQNEFQPNRALNLKLERNQNANSLRAPYIQHLSLFVVASLFLQLESHEHILCYLFFVLFVPCISCSRRSLLW